MSKKVSNIEEYKDVIGCHLCGTDATCILRVTGNKSIVTVDVCESCVSVIEKRPICKLCGLHILNIEDMVRLANGALICKSCNEPSDDVRKVYENMNKIIDKLTDTSMEVKRKTKCLMCKKEIQGFPALSRLDNKTKICSKCGMYEAMLTFEYLSDTDMFVLANRLDMLNESITNEKNKLTQKYLVKIREQLKYKMKNEK